MVSANCFRPLSSSKLQNISPHTSRLTCVDNHCYSFGMKKISLVIILAAVSLVAVGLWRAGQSLTQSLNQSKLNGKSVMPDSNVEWLLNELLLLPNDELKSLIVTTTVFGKVKEAARENGKTGGLKDYYVGEPGFYVYEGKISFDRADGTPSIYYFSPRRMKLMNIFRRTEAGKEIIRFEDIKPGDTVEIEESVDLSVPNLNDANVKSLTVTILE